MWQPQPSVLSSINYPNYSSIFEVGPAVASPSAGQMTLPWYVDYSHLAFWFFFC